MDRVASSAGPIASMFATTMTPATSAPTSQIGTTETGTTPRLLEEFPPYRPTDEQSQGDSDHDSDESQRRGLPDHS